MKGFQQSQKVWLDSQLPNLKRLEKRFPFGPWEFACFRFLRSAVYGSPKSRICKLCKPLLWDPGTSYPICLSAGGDLHNRGSQPSKVKGSPCSSQATAAGEPAELNFALCSRSHPAVTAAVRKTFLQTHSERPDRLSCPCSSLTRESLARSTKAASPAPRSMCTAQTSQKPLLSGLIGVACIRWGLSANLRAAASEVVLKWTPLAARHACFTPVASDWCQSYPLIQWKPSESCLGAGQKWVFQRNAEKHRCIWFPCHESNCVHAREAPKSMSSLIDWSTTHAPKCFHVARSTARRHVELLGVEGSLKP